MKKLISTILILCTLVFGLFANDFSNFKDELANFLENGKYIRYNFMNYKSIYNYILKNSITNITYSDNGKLTIYTVDDKVSFDVDKIDYEIVNGNIIFLNGYLDK